MKTSYSPQQPYSRRSDRKSTLAVAAAILALAAASFVAAPVLAQPETPEDVATDLQHAKSLSRAFRRVAETATPSVVTLSVKRNVRNIFGGNVENPFRGGPNAELFRRFQEEFERNPDRFQQSGVGSGVIIDEKGIILTNNHVVGEADKVVVRLHDGREFEATEVATDPSTDLAVLRIQGADDLKAAKLGNSDNLEIGDWVLAIGTPFDLEMTVSAGIISGKGRSLRAMRDSRTTFLQTDAAINPGNSGGPLLNLDGQVIGINTAIASRSGGNDGIGFAVPSNLAKWVADQLVDTGSVQRAYLGVSITEITAEVARHFGVRRASGVLVAEVREDSPAENAGLKEGDVITSIDGQRVRTPGQLQRIVEQSSLDSRRRVDILRDDEPMEISVKVTALPPAREL